jgi:outer membrane lipoprotein-sorting protein
MLKRITLAFGLLIFIAKISFAQYDPKALEILQAVSNKYKDIPVFKAKIIYSLVNESEGINDNFEGEIVIKGEKFRLLMEEQEIVNNGEFVWTFIPDVNEVSIDNYDPETNDINPTKILNAYKEGFKYLYLNDVAAGGEIYQVVDLVPEDPKNSQYFKIRLQVNKKDSMLKSWTMFDKSGNKYNYDVENFSTNLNPEDNFFVFDVKKHKGIEIIDLR